MKVWDRRVLRGSNSESGGGGAGSDDPKQWVTKPVGGFVGHFAGLSCVASRGDGRYLLTNGKGETA